MFTAKQILRFYGDKEIRKYPVEIQSVFIHAIDRILDEMKAEAEKNELSESISK